MLFTQIYAYSPNQPLTSGPIKNRTNKGCVHADLLRLTLNGTRKNSVVTKKFRHKQQTHEP